MKTYVRPLTCLLLLAAVIALPACKKATEKMTEAALERATGVKVDKDGNKATIKTEKGDVNIATADADGNVSLPAGFPADVILPGKHKVASVVDMAGMQMVNLTTPEAMNSVYAETDKGMQAGGWKRDVAMQNGDGATLAFSKEKRQVFYQLGKSDDGGTQLAIRTGTGE
ncbi:MAG: hypothetical protein KGL91_09945 [Xanthomonadaceae bacterium]|nr:hypothetical protein [Xanthomonadaceae bacterium]